MMLECAESEHSRIISHAIIFEVFQPMTTIPQRHGQTDR